MFDYYVSLGSACPMASSMSKYGLRSFSGPFDWLITKDFDWVLHYIETGFEDFMLKENLERFDDYSNHFRDKKSDIRFIHDAENFEKEYEKLKEKYERRINRFVEKSKSKICYLRSIRSENDYEYIENNTDYINRIIKRDNIKSEIVFLYNSDLSFSKNFQFRYFKMPGIWSGGTRTKLRSYFDHADDFLAFYEENYSAISLIKNLSVDSEQSEYFEYMNQLTERRYKTLSVLLEHDFKDSIVFNKFIIYGAGVIGKELYRKLKCLTTVICFVDREKAGERFENSKIISPSELKYESGVKIIVSATYDFENIKKELSSKFEADDIISLDKILNLNL